MRLFLYRFLFQGPFEVGNMILGFEGVTQMMLGLASSDRPLHQVRQMLRASGRRTKKKVALVLIPKFITFCILYTCISISEIKYV